MALLRVALPGDARGDAALAVHSPPARRRVNQFDSKTVSRLNDVIWARRSIL